MLGEQLAPCRRRTLLAGAAIGVGGLVIGTPTQAQDEAEAAYEWSAPVSANGWPILDAATKVRIEGSGARTVLLAPGAPEVILTYFIRRYLYEVAGRFEPGDVVGYRSSRLVAAGFESNYLSGTAVEIRPREFPLGAEGGLFPPEVSVIERILDDLGGVITWGRHLDPVKESHFEINAADGSAALDSAVRMISGISDDEPDSLHLSMVRRAEVAETAEE